MKQVILTGWMALAASLAAAAPAATSSAAPVTALRLGVAAERLVVFVELGSAASSQSVSLMIDLAAPTTLALSDDVMQALKLADGEKVVTLSAVGGFEASIPRDRLVPYSGALDLTRVSTLHASDLDDRPLAGTLGAGFLQGYDVVLDVQEKRLELLPRGSLKPDQGLAQGVRIDSGGAIRLPVTDGAGGAGELLLASDEYDSTAAAGAAVGEAAVQVALRGGSIDLSRYVTFRPAQDAPGDALRSGVGLLEHFRLQINWAKKRVALVETAPPADLTVDRAYFGALRDGGTGAMAEFLRLHPQSRFREEASRRLLDGRIAEAADDAAVVAAAQGYLAAVPEKARPEAALALVAGLREKHPQRVSMILGVGGAAIEAARVDPKSPERYRIHKSLGAVRFESGDIDGAWKDFLTAVFGLPDDPYVNLSLARIYEKQGRLGRALSRYRLTATLLEKNPGALPEADRAEVKTAVERLRPESEKNAS